MPKKFDKDRGFQADSFEKTLEFAELDYTDPEFNKFVTGHDYLQERKAKWPKDSWPREPGSSDPGDDYGYKIKPADVPYWKKAPVTEAEKDLYHGIHIHSEDNPLGLHTHVPGGSLTGGHSHGPQNRLGVHSHSFDNKNYMTNLDGEHVHSENCPDGKHSHCAASFA